MKLTIITVGKLKEQYLVRAVAMYVKEISKLNKISQLEIIEVTDEKTSENMSSKETKIITTIEGEKILRRIPMESFKVTLAIEGKKLDTIEFADLVFKNVNTNKDITFIIGGSLGLSDEVIKKSDIKISFSDMTFPHQLMRVILLEQIRRVISIK